MPHADYSYRKPATLAEIQQTMSYYSNYRYFKLYTEGKVFRLHEDVRSYLEQPYPNREEKQKAHGNFIWGVKKCFRTVFQKDAIALINANAKNLDLNDKDKVNFLNYVLNMPKLTRFSEASFRMLTDFSLEGEYMDREGRNVLTKMRKILDDKYSQPEDYLASAKRFYPYMDKYARECSQVSHNLVCDYAETLFQISSRSTYNRVSLAPLKNLMERTINLKHNQVKMNHLFGELDIPTKPAIDKKAVLKVIDVYAKHAQEMENKKANDTILYHSMSSMLCYIVQNYDYKPADIKAMRQGLTERRGSANQRRLLYDMGRIVQKAFKEVQPRKFNPRNKTVDPLMRSINLNTRYG